MSDSQIGRAGAVSVRAIAGVAVSVLILLPLVLTACANTGAVAPEVRSQLAPTGSLRVGLNLRNTLLTRKHPAGGEPTGIAVDIARELAHRIGVPVRFVSYESPGQLGSAMDSGAWDIAFFAIESARAKQVDFSPAYVQIDTTNLVRKEAPFGNAADVDQADVVIAVPRGAAYEPVLANGLQRAKLLRITTFDAGVEALVQKKADAVSGLKPALITFADKNAGFRVLQGQFASVGQAIGVPRGREAAARYLAEFVEDIKQSGFVLKVVAANEVRGLTVP